MPSAPQVPGAQTLIRNGLMQNDMDAQGFKIWNLDPTSIPPSGGPNSFPAVAHQWLHSYDSSSHNFSASQPDLLADISSFPSVSGQTGKFLTNNGTALSWGATPNSTAGSGIVNVRDFGAVGNGTTDDFAAITNAISYATAHNGLTVYFPAGRYRLSANLNLFSPVSMLGDSPYLSVLAGDPNVSNPVILIQGQGSVLQKLGVDGGANAASPSAPTLRKGIAVFKCYGVYILNCAVGNCSDDGFAAQYCYGIVMRDCVVNTVGRYGFNIDHCPRSLFFGNIASITTLSGIWVTNSPFCEINNNQVYSCGAVSYGVFCSDSDNSLIVGNSIGQCAIGIGILSSTTRTYQPQSHGYLISGNNVSRNYYAGLIIAVTNGTQVTGNTCSENGQGGTDHVTYSTEPGITIDHANLGSGYVVGDILTLTGGSGTAAKCIVTAVNGGAITADGLFPITLGNYTTFPTNPVTVTGGSGTGAKVVYTNLGILFKGAGYQIGQVLVSQVGNYYNPIRIMVTTIDGSGGVTSFQVLDGGGYFGTLPSVLSFVADALSGNSGVAGGGAVVPPTVPDSTSGLQLTPSFGLRYSYNFDTGLSAGIIMVGGCSGATLNSNILDGCQTGAGILIAKNSSFPAFASRMNLSANSIMGNIMGVRQRDGTTPPVLWVNVDSVAGLNLIFPRDPLGDLPI